MKKKAIRTHLAMLLTFLMLPGLMPAAALTEGADGPSAEIAGVEIAESGGLGRQNEGAVVKDAKYGVRITVQNNAYAICPDVELYELRASGAIPVARTQVSLGEGGAATAVLEWTPAQTGNCTLLAVVAADGGAALLDEQALDVEVLEAEPEEAEDYDREAFERRLAELEEEKSALDGASEREYMDMLRAAGVELDQPGMELMSVSGELPSLAEEGTFLGYVTVSMERFTLGNGYVIKPIMYPLYAGDTIADIVHYISGYQYNIVPVGNEGYYTSTGSLDNNFTLTGFKESGSSITDAVPDDIRAAVNAQGGIISGRQTSGWLKNGDIYSGGKWTFWLNDEYMGQADLTDYSSAFDMQTLKPGDVIRFQYSVTGDGRDLGVGDNRLYAVADKDRLTAKVAELNSYGCALLTDADYKSAYDNALAVLADLKASQQRVDEALLALMNEPAVDLDGVPVNGSSDILMGNIDGRIRVGEEFELTALDTLRSSDDNRNFVRGDMSLEVVKGKGLISIRRDLGVASGATANRNMSKGYTYFVKGLRQGVAIIKVSYPTYDGRETYVAIHVTNRDEDYGNAIEYSSNLDYITKYDTIHYDAGAPYYTAYADVLNNGSVVFYVNGSFVKADSDRGYSYAKDGKTYRRSIADIPLKNGYNTIIATATSGSVVKTRVYQIRASRTAVSLQNLSRAGNDIYEGDSVRVTFVGMVNPLPKISTLYNPSQGQISYKTDLPFLTQLYGSSSQYDVATSTLTFTATEAGEYSLYDGYLRVVGFGGSGWLETPVSQIPAYRGRPTMTVGGGGPNVPQQFMSYSFLPDIGFTVLENPEYNPQRVAATVDRASYAPGDTVTISIPELDIAEIRSHHDFWDEIIDDSLQDPTSQYFATTAITQASVVYSTDIPGLETVRTVEFVDVRDIVDNIRLGTPILDSSGNQITVINNYSEGAPVEGLTGLKTLAFKIPENTPSGTYKLKGGYVDVEYGPYWWVKYATYFGGEIEDVEITVQGAVKPEDVNDGTLREITVDRTSFIYNPNIAGSTDILDSNVYLNKAYITNANKVFNWTSVHNQLSLKFTFDGDSTEGTIRYVGADGETVSKYVRSGNYSVEIPLQLGDNQFFLTVMPGEGSTAPPTTYTFNVRRVVDDRITYYADFDDLYYTTNSPNSDIFATDLGGGYYDKGVIIYNEDDLTSDEPGRSYIEVGYYVEEILLSALTKYPEPNIGHGLSYSSYLNITQLSVNGIPFVDVSDQLSSNSSPLGYSDRLAAPIKLNVGVNEIPIHIDAGDFKTVRDHMLVVTRLPDVSLKTAEVDGGRLEAGGFQPGLEKIKVASTGENGRFTMTFTATEGAVITRDYPATAENIQALGQAEIDRLTIRPGEPCAFEAPEPIVSSTAAETPKEYPIYVTKTVDGREIVTRYTVAAYRASDTTSGKTLAYSPSVTYSNYNTVRVSVPADEKELDTNPDGVFRALTGAYKTRLGLLGGFVEYKLDNPIENDPYNKYGVDFIVYGAATSSSDAAPATVQVARDDDKDGRPDKWYTLAGSEYYTENTQKDVVITYMNAGTSVCYVTDGGAAGILNSNYPNPTVSSRWNSIVKDYESVTFTGDLLSVRSPAFGYANVHPMGLDNARPLSPDKPVNPYRLGDLYDGARGDGFDLAWAVDENGLPVKLDSVDFIRVSSSYLSADNSDVAESAIASIVDVTGESRSVGVASDIQSLKVNGEDFPLQEGVYEYSCALDGAQNVTISAMTAGANFYVNGEQLANEVESSPIAFDGANSRIVRLIIQSEEKAPKIYHLILEPKIQVNSVSLNRSSAELRVGDRLTLVPNIIPASANAISGVKWFSTAPSVAKVSGGLVTAMDEGTATISVQIGGKLAQCGVTVRYATVSEVIDAINRLPETIANGDRQAVETARAYYDSLTGRDKQSVTNYARLQSAEAALAQLPDPNAAVDEAMDLISYLPRAVTIYDEPDIVKARQAYEALDEAQKEAVSNYGRLLEAERALKELKLGEERYERVIGKIGLIPGSPSFNSETKIKDAREAYDKLTDVQKTYVSNYPLLVLAEEDYESFYNDYYYDVNRVTELLNSLAAPVSISRKADVLKAHRLYDALPAEKQALISSSLYNNLYKAETQLDLREGTSVYDYFDQIRDKLAMLPNPLTYGRNTGNGDRKFVYELDNLFGKISAEDRDAYLADEYASYSAIKATLKLNPTSDLAAIKQSFKDRLDNFPSSYTYLDYNNAYGLYWLVNGTNSNDRILKSWFDTELEQSYKDKFNGVVTSCYNAFKDNTGKFASMSPYVDAVAALGTLDVVQPSHKAAAEALLKIYAFLGSAQSAYQTSYPERYAVVQSAQAAMDAYWNRAANVETAIGRLPAVIAAEDRSLIEGIRSDYDALPEALKSEVENYARLVNAEAELAAAQASYDEAVNRLISMISSISDPVTLADRDAVKDAETAYRLLAPSQRALITNRDKLLSARQALKPILTDAAMTGNAADRIEAIETPVTLSGADSIRAARCAYNALTETQKAGIGQEAYVKLLDAELALAELIPYSEVDAEEVENVVNLIDGIPDGALYNDSAVLAARAAYDGLSEAEKQYVSNYNRLLTAEQNGLLNEENIQNVIDIIDLIPEGARYNNQYVLLAREAYDHLNEAEKQLVTNYGKLLAAERNGSEAEDDQAAANAVIALIALIPDGAYGNDSAVLAARSAYDALTAAQKALVSNYARLTAAEANKPSGPDDKTISVVIAVEKFTLGQGYIVEPVIVGCKEDGTVADVTMELLGDFGYQGRYSDEFDSYYFADIYDPDRGELNVPSFILTALDALDETKGPLDPVDTDPDYLGEFDYTSTSGWMVTVNNSFIPVGTSNWKLHNGDVIRWQFTLYGYGADLGNSNSSFGGLESIVPSVNKDALTRRVAEINGLYNKDTLLGYGDNREKYDGAMAVLENLLSTQTEINAALTALNNLDTGSSPGGGSASSETGGSTIAPAVTASGGTAAVSIDKDELKNAAKAAKAKGESCLVIAPKVTGTADRFIVELPKEAVDSVASDVGGLRVETSIGSVTIPDDALDAISSQAAGATVTISMETVAPAALSEAQRNAVGDKPVYDISILSGDRRIGAIGGGITVSLPYTLGEGEEPSGVTVWYLNDKGELEKIGCVYDTATKMATFTTSHLSYYLVGWEEGWTNPFADVREDDWFYESVKHVSKGGLFYGISDTLFGPNAAMTRAMLVTVLYRLEGSPAVTGTGSFADVKEGRWYADAIAWAVSNGIIKGYGGGLFGPDDGVTREQMAAILYGYVKYKGRETVETGGLAAYADSGGIAAWARTAMSWAVHEGIIKGVTETSLEPSGTATRAQVATILARFDKYIKNVK